MNKKGPKWEPCDTPELTGKYVYNVTVLPLEFDWLILTNLRNFHEFQM